MILSSTDTPLTTYIIDTECGRHFAWSAFDYDHLFRDLTAKGYRAKQVWTELEYETMQQEEQALLDYEHKQVIEGIEAA